ncbi:MAG: sialidase family protein [Phocaeicola sp.]|uniref:sialidase family protein n=2 Tax=Bacteroidaceae TaxID=815 RepID=UPI00234E80AB|nr:sialidase family protein [Phocaeicola oris]MCE2615775.1 glycoside hydrolase [Phocaeicola oris]
MKYLFLSVLCSICCAFTLPSTASDKVDSLGRNDVALVTRIVFDNSTSDVPYRIPALVQTRDGKLIADCDYRISKTDVGYSNRNGLHRIDNIYKVSYDNGRTWSEPMIAACGDEHATEEWRTAFGDPAMVADRTGDEVLLQTTSGKVGYFKSVRGNPQHNVFFHSRDKGVTWDKGTDLTQQIYGLYDGKLPGGVSPAGIFLTSGRIMQSRTIKVGDYYRLYIAHPLRTESVNKFASYVIYSDDFGHHWQVLGGPEVIPSDAADESKVEELPDGSVLLSCRNQTGGRQFNVFTYSDALKAEGTWGKSVTPPNMSGDHVNACNGEILVLPAVRRSDGKALYIAIQSIPLSTERKDVGFFYKELASPADYHTPEGLMSGWMKALQVSHTTSCYSTMIPMQNGHIGFLYEEDLSNEGYNIVFKEFTLEAVTEGKYSLGGD